MTSVPKDYGKSKSRIQSKIQRSIPSKLKVLDKLTGEVESDLDILSLVVHEI